MGAGSGPSEPEGVKTNSKEVNKSKQQFSRANTHNIIGVGNTDNFQVPPKDLSGNKELKILNIFRRIPSLYFPSL